MARGEAEFGINFLGASYPELDFAPLAEDPFVIACRRDHPLAMRKQLAWDQLTGHRVITVGRNSGNRTLIDNALAQSGRTLAWAYEVTHLSGALGLVEAGLAVAVLPRLATPASGHSTIRTIPLTAPMVTRTIGVVRRKGAVLAPSAAALHTILLETWKA